MLNLDDLLGGVGPSTPPAQAAPPQPPRLELRQNPQLTPQVVHVCSAGLAYTKNRPIPRRIPQLNKLVAMCCFQQRQAPCCSKSLLSGQGLPPRST